MLTARRGSASILVPCGAPRFSQRAAYPDAHICSAAHLGEAEGLAARGTRNPSQP